MTMITSEDLTKIAVKTVEGFLNDKIPLSVGLAKQASEYDLNSEQIKRCVEASNNIAYLKILSMSDDRTMEFGLAKSAEVLALLCAPEKQASIITKPITKQASTIPDWTFDYPTGGHDYSTADKTLAFIKSAAANQRELEDLNVESLRLVSELTKVAKDLSKDTSWIDKMSSANVEHFTELSVLVSGKAEIKRDFGDVEMFKEAQLKQVKSLSELYKSAKAIVREVAEKRELSKRAEAVHLTLTKQAFADMLGSAIGKGVGKTVVGAGVVGAGAIGAVKAVGVGRVAGIGADSAFYHPGHSKITGASKDVWDTLQGGSQ